MKKVLLCSKMASLILFMVIFIATVNNVYGQEYKDGIRNEDNPISITKPSLKGALAVADVSDADKLILMALYNSTNGANWTNNSNWGSTEPVNTWYGVTVVADEVTEIDLKDNNLSGSIPTELGDLLTLKYLDLDTNNLSGAIPTQLGLLTNLEYLYLDGNQLTGNIPTELFQLPNLLLLYLQDNQLTGSIPTPVEDVDFQVLRWLNLSQNGLSGTIPIELGKLPAIEFLNLSDNQLSGTIPTELGDLLTLKWLNLGHNLLTGTIPTQLGQFSTTIFQQLYLNDNQLTGDIPVVIGDLTGLKWLNLGQNQLTGSIPVELGQLSNLSLLYLDDNLLENSIPVELADITGLEWLNLEKNQLSGDIPAEIWQMTNLKLLYLNNNELTGSVPAALNLITNLEWLRLNANLMSSIPDIVAPVSLTDFLVANNQFSFEDLEPNMDLLPGINFVYTPQDSIGANQNFTRNVGESFSYALTTGGTVNSYQWYKNGEILVDQTSATLDIPSVAQGDGGYYYCEVTNSAVTGLTLTSKKINLKVNSTIQLSFNAGWNIFSSPVLPDDSNLKNILQPLIDAGLLKKAMDESGNAIEDWGSFGGWQNGIGDMERTEGYKINVLSSTTLDLEGGASQFPFEIQLNAGWNIISWPTENEQDGIDVFQDLIDAGILKKVMDESGNTIEDWGAFGGWQNFILNLKQGEGYKVNVTSPASLTINEVGAKSSVISRNVVQSTHFMPAFEGNGIDHMSINLVNLEKSGILEGDEIGIFDGDICVGAGKITNQKLSGVSLIASASDNNKVPNGFKSGDNVSLKLYRDGIEYPLPLSPVNNSSIQFKNNGTMFAEVLLQINTSATLQKNDLSVSVYPNPFNSVLNLEINLPAQQELIVEMFDINARKIRQLYKGNASGQINLNWDGRDSNGNLVADGIYMYRINNNWGKVIFNGN